MKRFAMTGASGYIAPRHLAAIRDTNNELVAALDPHDAVGVLDRYFMDVAYFQEFERFDRHLEKLRLGHGGGGVDFLTICSPNYLHDAHIRLALRLGANALCEKPLVLNPWNLDALEELEAETGGTVSTVLQLRVHPDLLKLRDRLRSEPAKEKHQVRLTYVTARGPWYLYSWKGDVDKSGGLVTNIGIHFFDLLMWLFGPVVDDEVHLAEPRRAAGFLELERAEVTWYLSIDRADLPFEPAPGSRTTFRSITVDGSEIEFSGGFTDLHTRVYEQTLAGRGFRIADARPSIELAHRIRHAAPVKGRRPLHPRVAELRKNP
jgi:UDP-N-acetyl-2-amino-2-deoxyglucuronate dehydrogenase